MVKKKIDLNKASAKEISSIPKVSINLAKKIVAARPFSDISNLYEIKGIGLATYNQIHEHSVVTQSKEPTKAPPEDFLIKRPDVVLLRFRAEDDGSVTLVAPDHDIEFSFSEPYAANRRQILTSLEASVVPAQFNPSLQMEVGSALTEAITKSNQPTAAKLLAIFQKAQGVASKYGAPMTLQLAFDEKALSSAQLPWELWHDGASHTLADERLRLNRYITYYGERVPYEPVDPLRVLYVLSRPPSEGKIKDLSGRYKKSVSRLGQRVQTDYIRQGTFEAFSNAIANGQYHIVHFDGHGNSDPASGTGGLLFESGSPHGEFVTSDRVSSVLKGSGVRLVVLAACLGSAVSGAGMFNAVAPALIRAGLPAVIANQFSIWDDAMGDFSEEFYASLARGESISAAVADGRRTMAHHRGQFFLPTLYMRVADGEGYLFSGEPETHRQWRMEQLQMLAVWWWGMTEVMRAHYLEGIIRGEGIDNKQPTPPKGKKQTPQKKKKEETSKRLGSNKIGNVSGIYEFFGCYLADTKIHNMRKDGTSNLKEMTTFYPIPRKLKVTEANGKMSYSEIAQPDIQVMRGGGNLQKENLNFGENTNSPGSEAYLEWERQNEFLDGQKKFMGWSETSRSGHVKRSFKAEDFYMHDFHTAHSLTYALRHHLTKGIPYWEAEIREGQKGIESYRAINKMHVGYASQGLEWMEQIVELIVPNPKDENPVIFRPVPAFPYVRIG
jgi:hypothetical protein